MNNSTSNILIPYDIEKNQSISANERAFKLTMYCIILSLATEGLGSYLFGNLLFTDVSTLFIYIALIIQITTRTLRFPKILGMIFGYIIVQTFIINFFNISFITTFKHFIGLILFSISSFSFVSVFRHNIINIMQIYYKFVFIIVCFAILQTLLFIFFRISFIPQNIISATLIVGGSESFSPEILGVLPRAVGLSTEPAHYAIIILPGVYFALLVLLGRANKLRIYNKPIAWIILIGFIMSFSLVGYFGLGLCLLSIFSNNIKGRLFTKVSIVLLFMGVFYFISQTNLSSKVTTLPTMFTDISSFQYTSSDLTGFALASNLIVANEGLRKSNYLGTGLNSHKDTYDEVIYNIFNNSQVIMQLNKTDAGSLFIRLTSEFGIPGIFAFILFLFHYRLGKEYKSSSIKYINSMCLIILISYASRNGGYLSIYFWFFFALYYYTFLLPKNKFKIVPI